MQALAYVYAYSMTKAGLFGPEPIWSQLLAHRIISLHECFTEASHEVSRLINEDDTDPDECFAVGTIPLCNDEHNLA
jgi:hypothetical protein